MKRIYLGFTGVLIGLALLGVGWTARGAAQGTEVGQPAAGPGPASIVGGGCALTKVKFKTSDNTVSTTSASAVNVPDMSVNFTVGGSAATCLEVEFSAVTFTAASQSMLVFAVLDGATVAPPGVLSFSTNNQFNAHAFHFMFPGVAPGAHTVKMRWLVGAGGGTIFMYNRSLVVHYQ